ncbi:MAG: MATE family efflux transporter, partial [Lachnospiraceae bacterium]|nr:MATE family efflux transporter [Lachnospiraceae bacterium]
MGDTQKENTAVKENKMGIMPIQKLIVNMSVPMMISMLVQALYNIVDSIFVAQISEDALTAVTLAFPLQNLMIAVAAGTGVGVNALLSKALGAREFKRSDKAANTAVLLALLSYVVFAILGLTITNSFIRSQTGDTSIIQYGDAYLGIVMTLSFGSFLQITFERLLQSTGQTLFSMVSQLTGAIINIIMDPIMIFGLVGFPKLGVAGAAYATVIGQIIAAMVGLTLNLRLNHEIHLSLHAIFQPNFSIIRRIYYVGIPSILMMSIGSVMT